ncbi:hypothetical protein ACFOLF_28595 [Paenibacillus sepulcri]
MKATDPLLRNASDDDGADAIDRLLAISLSGGSKEEAIFLR